ncbi:putative proteasome-type protease [Chthoniobacter flavus Ellin428]|uniref:Putative proteasome-type protease n=2 Tax=Chthoniobacter flavus TaxID=191863 RepID=B4D9V6_9BACT|nr:putative proteasome-type protease [Chthoniobacter flavus Ellin428]
MKDENPKVPQYAILLAVPRPSFILHLPPSSFFPMTYCLSLLCREGIVFISDSRTSAGVDNITVQPKMRIYAESGDRVICLMTSGNLSLTQSVYALIEEDFLLSKSAPDQSTLMNQRTLFETARYVGRKIRDVGEMDRKALEAAGFSFNINVLLGGQIAGQKHEIHFVYPQGNTLQASTASPFLQIGEFKYGKPILDRGFDFETSLRDAVTFGMLSMEATVKSNVSVGPPIDVFAYEADSLAMKYRARLEENDAYFHEIQTKWGRGLVQLVEAMPRMHFPGVSTEPGESAS